MDVARLFSDPSGFSATMVYLAALAFARIGTACLFLPGLGDGRIPARIRIGIGLVLSLSMVPALPPFAVPQVPAQMVLYLMIEMTIGAFLGIGAWLIYVAVDITGAQIGMAIGLSNAFVVPTGNNDAASSLGALLTMTVVALMFATDTDHLLIAGLLHSYAILPPGGLPMTDMVDQLSRLAGGAFYLSALIAAPFIIASLMLNLGLGLANRVMPAMQVFFVATPAMILIGLAILLLAAPSMVIVIVQRLGDWFSYDGFAW